MSVRLSPLIVALIGSCLVTAGCKQEKPVAQPTPASVSVPQASNEAVTDARLIPVSAAADSNVIPDFLLSTTNDLKFGNRELHGRVSLIVQSREPTEDNDPPRSGEAASGTDATAASPPSNVVHSSMVSELEKHATAPWFRYLQVIRLGSGSDPGQAPTSESEVSAITILELVESPESKAWLNSVLQGSAPASNPGSSPSPAPENQLVLLDPLGRIRGRYTFTNTNLLPQLLADLDGIWQEQIPVVSEILDTPWLEARRDAQLKTADSITVQHDFTFTDRQPESGIRFLHQIVDDAGRDYKGVHYDHGNGVAVADVNGDDLVDLYFVNQLGRNALYFNLGNGQFQDVTDSAGVAVGDRIGVSASFGDVDNDGDADLFVTSVRGGNLMFRNDGTGHFQDVTESSGLGAGGHCSAAMFFDYDRDGRLDLLVAHVGRYTTEERGRGDYYVGFKDAFSGHLKPDRTEPSRLYRNVDGTVFEDVTQATGLADRGWTGDAIVIDGNRDGWPDLYLPNMQGNDQYFENQAGKSFVARGPELFPMTPFGSMSVATLDFDNDLDLDLFVTDMHSDMAKDIMVDYRSELSRDTFYHEEKLKALVHVPESLLQTDGHSLFGNAFYRNDGSNQFAEISDTIGVENYWPWGVSSGDLNADGFEDLFVTSSMNYPYRYAINSLLLNEAGASFRDAEFVVGVEPRRNRMTAQPWFTADCEAETDERLRKICEGHHGQVVVWGSLGSRSSALIDIDNDGDLDIVTGEFNDVPMVLVSDLAQKHTVNALRVQLQGSRSNRQGLGAEVVVQVGDKKFLKPNTGKTGYLAHGMTPLYFGLGDATSVDSIEVRWPSGGVQTVPGPVASGQLLRIVEE